MNITKENSKQLREQAAEAARKAPNDTLAQRIKNRLIISWGEWVPDYEGWLKWSDSLYTADAVISAGDMTGGDQPFKQYQGGMKLQRDACVMEMGPIMQIVVENNVAALVYHMYLTPKAVPNAPTFDMMVTEFNTVEEIDGKLMVTRLDLYTDGGMNNH